MAIMPLPSCWISGKDISGKDSVQSGDRMTDMPVTYGLVEAALVKTYGVPAKAVGAFGGRLGNLQKQGLFGKASMPGKGVALRYSKDQIHRLIFACECFEFGLSPSVVLTMVKSLWES